MPDIIFRSQVKLYKRKDRGVCIGGFLFVDLWCRMYSRIFWLYDLLYMICYKLIVAIVH